MFEALDSNIDEYEDSDIDQYDMSEVSDDDINMQDIDGSRGGRYG